MKALMCVPNISEGTDLSVVEKVVDTIKSAPGVMLLDYSSDGDHNRSVISYIGAPDPVVAATKNLVKMAVDFIAVSYTHLTLPTTIPSCRSRWSPYH